MFIKVIFKINLKGVCKRLDDVSVIKGKGRSRLEVKTSEILLLEYLERHRLLTMAQLYKYFTQFLGEEIKEYSFKNRLRRLEEFKLVRSSSFAEGFDGERFKCCSIGTCGINLLIENGLLFEDYNKNQIYQLLEKRNKLHFLYTQEVVLNIMCTTKQRLSLPQYKHCSQTKLYSSLSPSHVPYEMWIEKASKPVAMFNKGAAHARAAQFINNNQQYKKTTGDWVTIIRPDWILKREIDNLGQKTRYLNIELDTGTEPLEQLEDKVWRYCILAEQDSDRKHGVLFVLPDESFSKRTKYGDRSQRISNIRNKIFNDPLMADRLRQVKLSVGVVSLKNAGAVATNFLLPELFK